MPKHVVRLLLLLGFFLVFSFAAKSYFTDPSYYRYGYYRADAVPQLAAGSPLYQGSAYCLECHEVRSVDWPLGVHKTVQCEVCHGADRAHPDNANSLIPADSVRLCAACHEAMPARPPAQPQIVLAEHPFPGEEAEPCQSCHDPHSPGDQSMDGESIAQIEAGPPIDLSAVVSKCARCHGKQGEGRKRNPALAGTESASFIDKMNRYRSGDGKSKAMNRAAQSLSDEEILELASYYGKLKAESPR